MIYYYIFSLLLTIFVFLIPFINKKNKEIKLRKEFTPSEKKQYYFDRANNPKLSFNQREYAKDQIKKKG